MEKVWTPMESVDTHGKKVWTPTIIHNHLLIKFLLLLLRAAAS
jgi:hypothetical protein